MTVEQTGFFRIQLGRIGAAGDVPLFVPEEATWAGDEIDLSGSIGDLGKSGTEYAAFTVTDALVLRDQLRGLEVGAVEPLVVPSDPRLTSLVKVLSVDVRNVDLLAGEFTWEMSLERVSASTLMESHLIHVLRPGSAVAAGTSRGLVGVPARTTTFVRGATTALSGMTPRQIAPAAGGGEVRVASWPGDSAQIPAYWTCPPAGLLDGATSLRAGEPVAPGGSDEEIDALLGEATLLLRAGSLPSGWQPGDGWANEGTGGATNDAALAGPMAGMDEPGDITLVGSGVERGVWIAHDDDPVASTPAFAVDDTGLTIGATDSGTWIIDHRPEVPAPLDEGECKFLQHYDGENIIKIDDLDDPALGWIYESIDSQGGLIAAAFNDDTLPFAARPFSVAVPPLVNGTRQQIAMVWDRDAGEYRLHQDGAVHDTCPIDDMTWVTDAIGQPRIGGPADSDPLGSLAPSERPFLIMAGHVVHNIAYWPRALSAEEVAMASLALSGALNPGPVEEQLGRYRTVVGRHVSPTVDPAAGWVLDNGMVRVRPNPEIPTRFIVECWDDGGWVSPINLEAVIDSGQIIGLIGLRVIVNEPHVVTVAVDLRDVADGSQPSLWLTLRRGSRIVECLFRNAASAGLVALAAVGSPAGAWTTSMLTDYARLTDEDDDGNRAILASTATLVGTAGQASASATASMLAFGVGHEVGGSTAAGIDTAASLAAQWAAATSEDVNPRSLE